MTAAQLAQEELRKKRERDAKFAATDPSLLGKDAQTVYRDKKGRRITVNEVLAQQEGKKVEDDDANMEWGVGLKQVDEKEKQREYEEALKQKPFAR